MVGPSTDEQARSVDCSQLLAAFDSQMRGPERLRLPDGVQDEVEGPVYRRWGATPHGFVSTGDLQRLTGTQLDALITRQIEFFSELSRAFEWKTYSHDHSADLTGRLVAHGFVPDERETLVIGRLSAIGQDPKPPAGVTIRAVSSHADTERMAGLLSEVSGEDRSFLGNILFSVRMENPENVVLLVAEANQQVVSCARLNLEPPSDFGSLWAGSTLPNWRGRGIYRALVAYRARIAADRGYRYLQVDATENSRPILERLGFITVSSTTPYIWTPPD
ncbi:MAG: GNAT family N-acetyltransferase [Candidatus Dormiibacterota bacterium]